MLLKLKPLFLGEVESLPVDIEMDLSGLDVSGSFPFKQPVRVQGKVVQSAGIVTLRVRASYLFDSVCDRCLSSFRRQDTIEVEHTLVTTLENEENEDFVLIDNYQLPLDDLITADILLELPMKNLCREDCRGLCPHCGKNLNDGLCGCKEDSADPRLAVLRQLLDQ